MKTKTKKSKTVWLECHHCGCYTKAVGWGEDYKKHADYICKKCLEEAGDEPVF